MADGKVVIDLEINDKEVDKKIDKTEKKIDKFAKNVSQEEIKPDVDADTSKLEKKLDEASSDVKSFANEAESNSKINGEAKIDTSKFMADVDKITSEARTAEKNTQVNGKATLKDKVSDVFEKIKNLVKKPIDIPEPNTNEFEQKLSEMEGKVTSFASNIAGALAIGAAVKQGVEIGVQSYTDLENALSRVRGALGETEAEAKASGQVIKDVYEAGVGESMDRVADAVIKIKRNLGNLDDGTLNAITQQAIILEDTFGVDMNETLRGAKGLMKNFGLSAQEAMDYIIAGTQEGLDWTDELGDNISEYSGKFSQAGYSAKDYFQLLKNGADSGAYNLDKVNDAINEVTTRLADGTIGDAIGSFSKETQKTFKEWQNGGATQKQVIDSIVSDITKCDNQQQALTMSATAFGTMGEDANLTFAKALSSVGDTFDDVSGKGQQFANDTTTPMQELEGKIRQLKDQLAPLGEAFINIATFAIDHFSGLAGIITILAVAFGGYKIATLAVAAATLKAKIASEGFFAALGLSPIGLIVAAIAALVAGFIYLWNTSEDFRNFWIGIWESIKTTVGNVIDSIASFFTETVPEAFNNFISYVSEFSEQVVEFFSNMWTGIVDFFTETIPSWIESVIEFFQQIPYFIGYMIGYIIGMFLQWGANLISFVTVDIPNFINGIITWFSQLPSRIWEWLQLVITNIIQWGTNMFNTSVAWVSQTIEGIVTWFSQLPSRIWNWLTSSVSKVVEWGVNLASKGKEAAQKLVTGIVDKVKEIPGKMAEIGSNLVKGLWEGIKNVKDWILDKIGSFCDGIVDGIKDFFGIKSPSRVMRDVIGKFLPPGIAVGFELAMPKSLKSMKSEAIGIVDELSGIMNFNLDDVSAGVKLETDVDNARQTAFETNVCESLEIDYDRMADANAKAMKNSGLAIKLNQRELGRVI